MLPFYIGKQSKFQSFSVFKVMQYLMPIYHAVLNELTCLYNKIIVLCLDYFVILIILIIYPLHGQICYFLHKELFTHSFFTIVKAEIFLVWLNWNHNIIYAEPDATNFVSAYYNIYYVNYYTLKNVFSLLWEGIIVIILYTFA